MSTRQGKRKATTEFSHVSPPPLPSTNDANADDYAGSEDEGEPVQKKKARKEKGKKPLAKKVAVWKDIKQWKEGDDPLGRFPLEVLDLIISVDSDLDLRDHLALAATCRYFRTCYRDVVFQVLFQAAYPELAKYSANMISIYDDGDPTLSYSYHHRGTSGPFERSLNAGRRIFSSGRSLVGAGGWTGWGLSRIEYDANKKDAEEQKEALIQALAQYWDERPVEVKYDADHWERNYPHWNNGSDAYQKEMKERRIASDIQISQSQRNSDRTGLRDVHGMDRDPADSASNSYYNLYGQKTMQPEYDPWPSAWRAKVAEVVLTPSVNKTTAKTKYKVTDRELLGLKERVDVYGQSKASKWYYKAAVEALSLRSHGGINGHAEHLAKLKQRKDKAHATRVKNGTVVVKKPKPPTRRQLMWQMQDKMREAFEAGYGGAMFGDETDFADDSDDYDEEGMFYNHYGSDYDDEDEDQGEDYEMDVPAFIAGAMF